MLTALRFLALFTAATLATMGLAKAQGHEDKPASNAAQASPSSPGAPQEFLAKRAGEYTRSIKFTGQSNEWAGTSEITVLLGGRFIMEHNRDTVMGRPVEGMRIYGYNNVTKQYEAVTMYTMSTAITKLSGTSNDGGKTVDYSGESDEPRGKVPLHARVTQIDDDHFVLSLSTTGPDGKEMTFQETTYTRKK
jgi:Protein of unknown function (DUF1579)